ncbi:MAG: hypothetical protein ACI9AF_000395, partial [Granulosicoccus sp.]
CHWQAGRREAFWSGVSVGRHLNFHTCSSWGESPN